MKENQTTILTVATIILLSIIALISYFNGIKAGIFWAILLSLLPLLIITIPTALVSIFYLFVYLLRRKFKKSLLLLVSLIIFFLPLLLIFKPNYEGGKLSCKIRKENLIKIYNCKSENFSLTGKLFCLILPDTTLLGFETKKLILKGETLNSFQPTYVNSEKKTSFPPNQIYETLYGNFKTIVSKDNASSVIVGLNPLNITQIDKTTLDTNLLSLVHWDSGPSKDKVKRTAYKNKRKNGKYYPPQSYALQTSLNELEKASIAVFIRAPFFLIPMFLQILAAIPLFYLRVVRKREEFFLKARYYYLIIKKEINEEEKKNRQFEEANRQFEVESEVENDEEIEKKEPIRKIRGIKTLLAHTRKKKIKELKLSKTSDEKKQ